MNKLDKVYTDLLQDILDNGVKKQDRTGTGTISVFGRQIRHNMSDGFPLLTTKKMPFKIIVTELLWFLRGDTNIKYLVDNNCHIWDGDAYKNYCKNVVNMDPIKQLGHGDMIIGEGGGFVPFAQEEFINKIKKDDEFADKWGELGPIYGKQWRKWQGWMSMDGSNRMGSLWYDQIARLIHDLKTNPDSRRLMVNAWNVGELDKMALPPCHYGFQVYTRELSYDEKVEYARSLYGKEDWWNVNNKRVIEILQSDKRAISLMWNQRSVDTGLGWGFNVASYGLLLMVLAKQVNMVPDELICSLGDCHIYLNHIDGLKEQLERSSFALPTVKISDRTVEDLADYTLEDFLLENYESHPSIKLPLSN